MTTATAEERLARAELVIEDLEEQLAELEDVMYEQHEGVACGPDCGCDVAEDDATDFGEKVGEGLHQALATLSSLALTGNEYYSLQASEKLLGFYLALLDRQGE